MAANDRVCIVFDERTQLHKPSGGHPENPTRVSAALSALDNVMGLCCVIAGAAPATDEDLLRVHSRQFLDSLERHAGAREPIENECFQITADTYVCADSVAATKAATGCALTLSRGLADGTFDAGIAVVRPPGHHATAEQAMGFCLVNHIAVCVRDVLARHADKRVAVIDWDIHHFNGTQDVLQDEPRALLVSVHRHDGGWYYPGTGRANETGTGATPVVNVPLRPNDPAHECTRAYTGTDYVEFFARLVLPVLRDFAPDVILVSAGFDAASGDPIGHQEVEPAAFGVLTNMLQRYRSDAPTLCPVGLVLEGGYSGELIGECLAHCARAMIGACTAPSDAPPYAEFGDRAVSPLTYATMLDVLEHHGTRWPSLAHAHDELATAFDSACRSAGVAWPAYEERTSLRYPTLTDDDAAHFQVYQHMSLSQFLFPGGLVMARRSSLPGVAAQCDSNDAEQAEWLEAEIVRAADGGQFEVRVPSLPGAPCALAPVHALCRRPFRLGMRVDAATCAITYEGAPPTPPAHTAV